MIISGILNFLLLIVNNVLDIIPVINIAFSLEYFDGFLGFINFCTYLFPCYALWPLLGIAISLTIFRVAISVIKFVVSIIPV